MTILKADNLVKSYGKKSSKPTINNVSFEIEQGESVAIIGKSGSGKSTLLNILSGILSPDSGTVYFQDKDIFGKNYNTDSFRTNSIGLIFQSFYLQPNNTVFENVFLPLEISGKTGKEYRQKVQKVLEQVGLADKINEKTVNLSGGQKQRVAIARSLVNDPKIIFADEPTGNLDSQTTDQITDLLFDIQKQTGATLVIVTHDISIAEKCKRGIHIVDGQIESIDNF